MGSYLSKPVTDKVSNDGQHKDFKYGDSSMQGWRLSQEDAHNCIGDYDTNSSLFAVYDGHGGPEVAEYCSLKLPYFIKESELYKEGKLEDALREGFLEFDKTLTKAEVIKQLKILANRDGGDSVDEEDEVDLVELHQEAHMPLEKLLSRYGNNGEHPRTLKLKKRKEPLSPYLRAKSSDENGNKPSSSKDAGSFVSPDEESHKSAEHVKSESKVVDEEKPTSSTDIAETPCSSSQESSTTSGKEPKATEEPSKTEQDSAKNEHLENSVSEVVNGSSEEVPSSTEEIKNSDVLSKEDVPSSTEQIKNSSVSSKEDVPPLTEKINSDVSSKDAPSSTEKINSDVSSKEEIKKNEDNNNISVDSKPLVNGTTTEGKGKALLKKGKHKAEINHTRALRNPKKVFIDIGDVEIEDDSDDDSEDMTYACKESESDEDDDGEEVDSEEESEEEEEEEEEDGEDEEDETPFILKEEAGSDTGCTAVVALIQNQRLIVANAGDSRCVVCRNGKAHDMSHDHKPEDKQEWERIVNAGGKVTGDGRVNGGLNLSRAIGDHAYKQNSLVSDREQMITALPDIECLDLDWSSDEFMVLACDGIWNCMSSDAVVEYVRKRIYKEDTKLSQICESLFDNCLSATTMCDGSGCDNMTCIIVKFPYTGEIMDQDNNNSGKREASPIPEQDQSESKRPKLQSSHA